MSDEKKISVDSAVNNPYTSEEEAIIRLFRRVKAYGFGTLEVECKFGEMRQARVTENLVFGSK